MKNTTKKLKSEMQKDISSIYNHNNSKDSKYTSEQKAQHLTDKTKFYFDKWNKLLLSAETKTQKEYCNNVLSRIEYIR